MYRRSFLSILAGSPLVFGLRELLAQEPATDHVDAALKRMKDTRRYGVFLVIPADKESRKRLGEALLARLPTGSKAGRHSYELFCANVFVCLSDARAAKALVGAKVEGPGVLRILLDPAGKQVAADRVPLEVVEDPAKFQESFAAFIHGADGRRLRDHAAAIEKAMPEELKRAASRLEGDPSGLPEAAAALKAAADSIAPWLVQKKIEAEGSRFEAILWDYYLEQSLRDPEPSLPYGVRVKRIRVEDPCPPCGMAAYRPSAYRFLEFLAK